MSAEKRERSLPQLAVNVLGVAGPFNVTHDCDSLTDSVLVERCGLSEESTHPTHMILGEHRGDRIMLRSKLKQDEILETCERIKLWSRVIDI